MDKKEHNSTLPDKLGLVLIGGLTIGLVVSGCSNSDAPSSAANNTTIDITVAVSETSTGPHETLSCDEYGPTGTYEKAYSASAYAACSALLNVDMKIFDPDPTDRMCTEIYGGPQVADIVGTIKGNKVSSHFTRINGCEIYKWEQLADVFDSMVPKGAEFAPETDNPIGSLESKLR